MRHEWGARAGPLVLSNREMPKDTLEKVAPVLLCKLEKIFPPGFFLPMQHLIVHLLSEARLGGPCRPVGAIQSRDV